MALRDIFSRRAARAAKAGTADVYQYDDLPDAFRVQVVHIWQRALGDFRPRQNRHSGGSPTIWLKIHADIAESHGLLELSRDYRDSMASVANYFLQLKETHQALDVIEVTFQAIDSDIRAELGLAAAFVTQHPDDAITDLNERFREHGIGFQYLSGQIVRVDSQYVHTEAVKPALTLLADPTFAGPQDEFLRAHEHYREGNHKEAVNEALKAFESTMKVICDARKWTYDKDKATASKLVEIIFANQLVPSYLQNAFGGLRSVLESAVPTPRNRTSGHGQGASQIVVPGYLAAYVLHMTASTIVFLVDAHKTKS